MALPASIYRVNIQLADVDRGVYEALQATVARHPSETEERLVTRLLAYALFFEPELTFCKGLSAADEPELWVKGPDGRVSLWVEVGLPDADRIIKASRHSLRVALVASGRTLVNWEQQQLPKLHDIQSLVIYKFNQQFINCLVAKLARCICWEVTVSDGSLYINVGDETFETALQGYGGLS